MAPEHHMPDEHNLPELAALPLADLRSRVSGQGRLPRHVAVIMDGNGRWARRRRLPRVAGHRAGPPCGAPSRPPAAWAWTC